MDSEMMNPFPKASLAYGTIDKMRHKKCSFPCAAIKRHVSTHETMEAEAAHKSAIIAAQAEVIEALDTIDILTGDLPPLPPKTIVKFEDAWKIAEDAKRRLAALQAGCNGPLKPHTP